MLGTSLVSLKGPKRDAPYKPNQLSKVTIEDLTVELAKTQVIKLTFMDLEEVVRFTKLL